MPGKLAIIAALATVLVLVPVASPAQLPKVTSPGEEPAPVQPADRPQTDEQSNPNAAPNGLIQVKQPRPVGERKEQPLDFDLLMKTVSDPRAPLAGPLARQLQDVAAFSQLTVGQQNKAVPELIALLKNQAPLAAEGIQTGGALQVRHRANLALARMAAVYFGQFPARKADEQLTDEQKAADRKASEELAGRWVAWWKEAQDLDQAGRKELAAKLRAPLLETGEADAFWTNVRFCQDQMDATPLPKLTERLRKADAKDPRSLNTLISAYGTLCQASGAPTDAGLVLVELLKRLNTPENCRDMQLFMTLRTATVYLRRITGGHLTPYLEAKEIQVEQGGETRTVTVHMITDEAIKGWEEAIKAKAAAAPPKPDEKPAEEKAKTRPDEGNARPRANLRIQIAPVPAPGPQEGADPAR